MKIRFVFQKPPHAYWIMVVHHDTPQHAIAAKVFYPEWRSKYHWPPYRLTYYDALRLAEACRATAKIYEGR